MRITENLIFSTALKLLEEQPVSKITVTDIVRRCQINRNTFYYHFAGMEDLVRRLLQAKMKEFLGLKRRFRRPVTFLFYMMLVASKYKTVVLNLYHSDMRGALEATIESICHHYAHLYMASLQKMNLSDTDRELLIRYWKTIASGIFLDWLKHDMEYDMPHAIKRICFLMAGNKDLSSFDQLKN